MSLPELVRERLGEERPRARIPLGGDDELVVTPSRTLIYRAEGLLSGESIEEHAHQAERVAVTEGRRKSTIRLDHGLDGESEFTVPSDRLDDLLEPLFTGVLSTTGTIPGGETVEQVYRGGELTLIVTESRVLKHIGAALWDAEYEEYPFEEVSRLDLEAGDVSSQIIIEVAGRPDRIKVPSDEARAIRQWIEQALLAYHGAESYAAFRDHVAAEDDGEPASAEAGDTETAPEIEGTSDFGGIATIGDAESADADPTDPAEPADDESADDGVDAEETELEFGPQAAGKREEPDVADELADLRAAVERQNELLEEHHETLERLIEELRRGR